MDISVVIVAHNMARELPRTLQSLCPSYQRNETGFQHEVIVVDNGSSTPLRSDDLTRFVEAPMRVESMVSPSVSPAAAMNHGISCAAGEIVCLMIDGAHVLTPGVLDWTLRAFRAFEQPIVATRYFYFGPGDQPETVKRGYDQQREDELFGRIDWPSDGYRLFEIGAALRGPAAGVTWLNRMFESNCLAIRRELAVSLGGMDESFSSPGGGFVNLDFFKRACETPGASLVELIGEGSFHQVHGGTTTNVTDTAREERLTTFRHEYERLRGDASLSTEVPLHFLGHLPTEDAKIHRRKHGRLAAR